MRTSISIKIVDVDHEGYHIFVMAKVNGKLANLLIDTGASRTVFDSNRIERFAKKNSMLLSDHMSTGLGTNSMQSHTLVLKKIQLGDLILTNHEIFLLDLSHVNETYENLNRKNLDGVIGGDVLFNYNAVINYKKKLLLIDSLYKK